MFGRGKGSLASDMDRVGVLEFEMIFCALWECVRCLLDLDWKCAFVFPYSLGSENLLNVFHHVDLVTVYSQLLSEGLDIQHALGIMFLVWKDMIAR